MARRRVSPPLRVGTPFFKPSFFIYHVHVPQSPPDGLELKYRLFDVIASWAIEPDMAVAKEIAIRHLPVITSSYEISFFSARGFHKLFLLHPLDDTRGTAQSFIIASASPSIRNSRRPVKLQHSSSSRKTRPYLFPESSPSTPPSITN